jgi:hypothetical protein
MLTVCSGLALNPGIEGKETGLIMLIPSPKYLKAASQGVIVITLRITDSSPAISSC